MNGKDQKTTPVETPAKDREVTFLKDHQLDGESVKKGEKRLLPAAYAEHLISKGIVK